MKKREKIIDIVCKHTHYCCCYSPFQIEFLNSVIVDLQRKNEELKDKLEKMAAAALNGNNASDLNNYDRYGPFSANSLEQNTSCV